MGLNSQLDGEGIFSGWKHSKEEEKFLIESTRLKTRVREREIQPLFGVFAATARDERGQRESCDSG